MSANPKNISLEPAAQAFVEATSKPPFAFQLPVEQGRAGLDASQDEPIFKPEIDEEWIEVPGGPTGTVKVRIVRPRGATGTLPVILYLHGAGWVFGDAHTHDRLVRDLAVGTGAAVAFVEFDRAPEAKYPHQLEQEYAVAQWITGHGADKALDGGRIAIAGDSVGGNMTAALTLLAKRRGDVHFVFQVLFYPVTDANFDTGSYREFAEGYFLTREAMKWFWDQYTTDPAQRAEITASPLRASLEDLAGLPPAYVATAEYDPLRDEAAHYAARLIEAGVNVEYRLARGQIHGFIRMRRVTERAGIEFDALTAAVRRAFA